MALKAQTLRTLCVTMVAAVSLLMLTSAASASATEMAWWQLNSFASPTYIHPGGEAYITIRAINVGEVPVSGVSDPVTVTDKLPSGLTATEIVGATGNAIEGIGGGVRDGPAVCSLSPQPTCVWRGPDPLAPYEKLTVVIKVKAATNAQTASNEASIVGGEATTCYKTGGGRFVLPTCRDDEEASPVDTGSWELSTGGATVPAQTIHRTVIVKEGEAPFGITYYALALESPSGSPETQAGAHPFQFSTSLDLNEKVIFSSPESIKTRALPRNIPVALPPGLIGNPTRMAQCSESQFDSIIGATYDLCEPNTQIGVATIGLILNFNGNPTEPYTASVPLFNLPPAPGEPAKFGFVVEGVPVTIDTEVRTGRDYAIVATVNNITQNALLLNSTITVWGVPGAAVHNISRGWNCLAGNSWSEILGLDCNPEGEAKPLPFMTLPTSCAGELQSSASAEAWDGERSGAPLEQPSFGHLDGCNGLTVSPQVSVAPDVQEASKPTGLNVHIHVPQEASLDPDAVSGANIRDTTVTLPEGVTIDPAGADGLEACTESEIGYIPGESVPPSNLIFTSGLPAPKEAPPEPFCPDASKIGTVKITLPILTHALEGAVYLATQNTNPFGSLVAMYIVAEDPVSGVLVKLPGEVSLNQNTGQVTATFENTPDAPFEDFELHFFGGDRAPLSTPPHCGVYETKASFTPWSGNAPVISTSNFDITSGPNGSSCANPLPFAPALTAGTTSNQAGGFSPFTMTMSREDGNQNLKSVQLHMPPGLSGVLTGVPLCGEAQADAGTCGAGSLIGETTVSVGLGSNPYTVTGGKVYLTGPYEGAPFGLSIVNPANAGPFHLGNVIVRAKIEVDPYSADLTITSDGSGPYAIPPNIQGIPLEIKHINVSINRPGFTFNPTDCNPLQITGTLGSIEGSSAALSVPFQVTNCATLKFQPKLTASTNGKTSRATGASLSVKLTYPSTPQGTETNIKSVKVDLPRQLPSQLKTLQKACVARVFEANPAGCPAASIVGHAKAITPIVPVPLEGPAYFVSHGGEAFPSLIIVLQGYGVKVNLVGTTYINKAGITSSTFKSVPDVPVGTFELNLPQGKFPALAANGNLCKAKLAMPTAFLAQDGQEIHDSTKITATGCPKATKTRKRRKHADGKRRK